ncbi:MAG: Hpt domain-containing protein [Pseudomonadota bacterium]
MPIAETLLPDSDDAGVLDVADGVARVMGDRALFERMLRRFGGDYRDGVAPIRAALRGGDLPLAHRLAHTLKGAAGMISAHALHRHADLLERALREGDGDTGAAIDAAGTALAGLLPTIDRLLGDAAAHAEPAASPAMQADHALLARLAALLANGDGAAVDLLEESGTSLAAALGPARFADVALAAHEFDFEGALKALRLARDDGGKAAGG